MSDSREWLIRLIGEERQDGSLIFSSPEIPLLHVALANKAEIETVVLPILKEMMERRYGGTVELRLIDVLESDVQEPLRLPTIPAHVIAQMVA